MALIPGMSFVGAGGGLDQLALLGLQNPQQLSTQLAGAGIPPPTGPANPASNLGSMLQGVQAPGALPGPAYSGGISGAQGVPSPAAISGAASGVNSILGRVAPAVPVAPVTSLGSLIRGGR